MNKNNNNQQSKFKTVIEFLKDAWKNPRGRAIYFFAFYIVFFAVVISLVRGGTSNNTNPDKNKSTINYSLSEIEKANYHYTYKINYNNQELVYDGDKINSKERFKYTVDNVTNEYYRNNDLYLEYVVSNWVNVDNPYALKEFLNIDMIKTILDSATYTSKTDYESGSVTYHYEISTTTLTKLLTNQTIDIDDLPNKIDVTTEEDDIVDEITYDLSSYEKYTIGSINCNITLSYSNFGKITKIQEP